LGSRKKLLEGGIFLKLAWARNLERLKSGMDEGLRLMNKI
jgi:hypothetical protein